MDETETTTAALSPVEATREAESLRLATPADRERVVTVLARAMYDDPVFRWLYPDDERRMMQIQGTFRLLGEQEWFDHGLTYTTDRLAGAAVWVPPEQWNVSAVVQLRRLPGYLSVIGLRDMPRALRAFNLVESKHPHERHYYLSMIGVDPAWQGKGLGTALLRPVLDLCDREGSPAYLEATSPRSRACYERNGFRTTGEIVMPNGPPFWPMWREPGAG